AAAEPTRACGRWRRRARRAAPPPRWWSGPSPPPGWRGAGSARGPSGPRTAPRPRARSTRSAATRPARGATAAPRPPRASPRRSRPRRRVAACGASACCGSGGRCAPSPAGTPASRAAPPGRGEAVAVAACPERTRLALVPPAPRLREPRVFPEAAAAGLPATGVVADPHVGVAVLLLLVHPPAQPVPLPDQALVRDVDERRVRARRAALARVAQEGAAVVHEAREQALQLRQRALRELAQPAHALPAPHLAVGVVGVRERLERELEEAQLARIERVERGLHRLAAVDDRGIEAGERLVRVAAQRVAERADVLVVLEVHRRLAALDEA